MSGDKQRKARQRAQREQWERANKQELLAQGRRRRRVILFSVLAAVAGVVAVVSLVVAVAPGDDPAQRVEEPSVDNTEMLASEAAADAQASAAAESISAGEVVVEDYTIEPGTAVDSGRKPAADDRPTACGAKAPGNARATRPRYPGGPADVLRDGVDYVATIETSCGPITIDLLESDAPIAVNSFVFLAKEGFYNGLEVFRDFGGIGAAQAGSGDNTLGWDTGYQLPDELDLPEREGYPVGTVTTFGEGPYTAGSEFLIAYGKEFDAGFRTSRTQTTFGRVLDGMDVIYTMTAMDRTGPGGEAYAQRLFMESVTISTR